MLGWGHWVGCIFLLLSFLREATSDGLQESLSDALTCDERTINVRRRPTKTVGTVVYELSPDAR